MSQQSREHGTDDHDTMLSRARHGFKRREPFQRSCESTLRADAL